jgi:hypothetical protein
VLDFQSGQRPRNYLARRQQWRLLILVMLLGMVVMAAVKARDADNYRWLFALGGAGSVPPTDDPGETPVSVDTRVHPVPQAKIIPGSFISRGATIHSEETSSRYFPGVKASYLSSIRDDSPFRPEESDAWFSLLGLLGKTDPAELRAASTGWVTFIQLFRQPDEYRGELVTIRGTVVRAHRLTAPDNDHDIDGYYQTWIRPADNRHYPIVAYLLELPERFPTGMDVSAEVEITGFFFKRWAYQAQDTLRSAPVVLARSVEWKEPSPPIVEEDIGLASILAAIVGSILFAVLVAWTAYRRTTGRGPSQRELPPTLKIVPVLMLLLPLLGVDAFAAESRPFVASGPRGVLELMGIGQEHFDRFIDGRPWHEDEEEVLLKLIYRIGRDFQGIDIEQWSHGTFRPDDVQDNPGAYRGEVFHILGQVVRVESEELDAELAETLELNRFYRCEFVLGQSGERATVFSQTIPEAWKVGEKIAEQAGAYGYFLKLASDDSGRDVSTFIARRIAWYPPTPLGRLGMDCGLLDDVRMGTPGVKGSDSPPVVARNNPDKLRLTAADRECFYQMLDVVDRAAPGELLRRAAEELKSSGEERFSVEPLFNRPGQQQGRLVAFTGTVRRVLLVRVSDEDILSRFGVDHYYQLYLFTDDSQGNPLVFCVRRLPPGMSTGDGAEFQERVTVAGFFLKTWAYRINRPRDVAKSKVESQFAPLLIGKEPIWHRTEPAPKRPFAGLTAGLAVLLVLFVVWLVLLRISRGDRKLRGRWKCLGEENSPNGPDFSQLHRETEADE